MASGLITGGSRGIGRAAALRFAASGRHVVLTYRRRREEAEAVVAEIRAAGGSAVARPLELEDADAIAALVADVERTGPPLTALVANAAASAFKPVADFTESNLARSWATNARSFVLLAQAAAPGMRERGGGRIVAVTSYGSGRAFPRYGALGADKAAIESWVRAMAAEWGPDGVTVNAVSGGVLDTDSARTYYGTPGVPPVARVTAAVPLRRLGTADEVAAAIAFLCSPDASYITGAVLPVDGGLTVVVPPHPSEVP